MIGCYGYCLTCGGKHTTTCPEILDLRVNDLVLNVLLKYGGGKTLDIKRFSIDTVVGAKHSADS